MVSRLIALLLAAAVSIEAAAGPAFAGKDILGSTYGNPDYAFRDHDGRSRTLRDFRGKVTLLFFGYMNCPNFCPLTLLKLKNVMSLLGEDARRVQVAYVTLDPERDTPASLKSYVHAFDPGFTGLYATTEGTPKMALAFRIFNERVKGLAPGSYSIDHSTFMYVYDARTRLRLRLADELSEDEVAADVRRLLEAE